MRPLALSLLLAATAAAQADRLLPEPAGGLDRIEAAARWPAAVPRDEGGVVFVEVVIDERGQPADPDVLESPGDWFSASALDAVLASRWRPARADGRDVARRCVVPVGFGAASARARRDRAGEPELLFVGGVETAPTLVGGLRALQARVAYPADARAEGVEGRATVQFVVDACGVPMDIETVRSPDPRLSVAAEEAVRRSRFLPGFQRGRPVAVRFAVPVTFRLGE